MAYQCENCGSTYADVDRAQPGFTCGKCHKPLFVITPVKPRVLFTKPRNGAPSQTVSIEFIRGKNPPPFTEYSATELPPWFTLPKNNTGRYPRNTFQVSANIDWNGIEKECREHSVDSVRFALTLKASMSFPRVMRADRVETFLAEKVDVVLALHDYQLNCAHCKKVTTAVPPEFTCAECEHPLLAMSPKRDTFHIVAQGLNLGRTGIAVPFRCAPNPLPPLTFELVRPVPLGIILSPTSKPISTDVVELTLGIDGNVAGKPSSEMCLTFRGMRSERVWSAAGSKVKEVNAVEVVKTDAHFVFCAPPVVESDPSVLSFDYCDEQKDRTISQVLTLKAPKGFSLKEAALTAMPPLWVGYRWMDERTPQFAKAEVAVLLDKNPAASTELVFEVRLREMLGDPIFARVALQTHRLQPPLPVLEPASITLIKYNDALYAIQKRRISIRSPMLQIARVTASQNGVKPPEFQKLSHGNYPVELEFDMAVWKHENLSLELGVTSLRAPISVTLPCRIVHTEPVQLKEFVSGTTFFYLYRPAQVDAAKGVWIDVPDAKLPPLPNWLTDVEVDRNPSGTGARMSFRIDWDKAGGVERSFDLGSARIVVNAVAALTPRESAFQTCYRKEKLDDTTDHVLIVDADKYTELSVANSATISTEPWIKFKEPVKRVGRVLEIPFTILPHQMTADAQTVSIQLAIAGAVTPQQFELRCSRVGAPRLELIEALLVADKAMGEGKAIKDWVKPTEIFSDEIWFLKMTYENKGGLPAEFSLTAECDDSAAIDAQLDAGGKLVFNPGEKKTLVLKLKGLLADGNVKWLNLKIGPNVPLRKFLTDGPNDPLKRIKMKVVARKNNLAVVAFDLGNYQSCFAAMRDSEPFIFPLDEKELARFSKSAYIRSSLALSDKIALPAETESFIFKTHYFIGPEANEKLKKNPYWGVTSVKTLLSFSAGAKQPFDLEREHRSIEGTEIVRLFLDPLKGIAERNKKEILTRCVVTVPVDCPKEQREGLRTACKAIGLDDPQVIDEPIAAAIYLLADLMLQKTLGLSPELLRDFKVLIADVGGGTSDLALLRVSEKELHGQQVFTFEVLALAGVKFGGIDVTNALANVAYQELAAAFGVKLAADETGSKVARLPINPFDEFDAQLLNSNETLKNAVTGWKNSFIDQIDSAKVAWCFKQNQDPATVATVTASLSFPRLNENGEFQEASEEWTLSEEHVRLALENTRFGLLKDYLEFLRAPETAYTPKGGTLWRSKNLEQQQPDFVLLTGMTSLMPQVAQIVSTVFSPEAEPGAPDAGKKAVRVVLPKEFVPLLKDDKLFGRTRGEEYKDAKHEFKTLDALKAAVAKGALLWRTWDELSEKAVVIKSPEFGNVSPIAGFDLAIGNERRVLRWSMDPLFKEASNGTPPEPQEYAIVLRGRPRADFNLSMRLPGFDWDLAWTTRAADANEEATLKQIAAFKRCEFIATSTPDATDGTRFDCKLRFYFESEQTQDVRLAVLSTRTPKG